MGLASLISRSPWSGAYFTFWTPWQGGCPATTWADARCARGSPNPTERPPWSEPKTGRSDGTDTDPPCSSPPPPTAQSLFPPLRAPVVSPLLVLQQIYTSHRATVSRAQGPSSRSSPKPPTSTRGDGRRPVGKPASTPARLTQRRQAAALDALPRLPTAPSRSRCVWKTTRTFPPTLGWLGNEAEVVDPGAEKQAFDFGNGTRN